MFNAVSICSGCLIFRYVFLCCVKLANICLYVSKISKAGRFGTGAVFALIDRVVFAGLWWPPVVAFSCSSSRR